MQVSYQAENDDLNKALGKVLLAGEIKKEPIWDEKELFINKQFQTDAVQGCSLLFRKYYAPLCNHAVRYLYSKELAEDLVSEVFHEFWKNKIYERISFSYKAYLFRIVRNRVISYLRSQNKEYLSIEDNLIILNTQSPEEIMLYDELHCQIQQLVDELPPQCKKVFLMSRFESKSIKEIAKLLSLSPRTIETHISKALSLIRKTMEIKEL